MKSINPKDLTLIKSYGEQSDEQITKIINNAHHSFLQWRDSSHEDRSQLLLSIAKVLREEKNTLATLMQNEMGKLISEGESEIEKCALVCEYYAKNAASFLADKEIESGVSRSYVMYCPKGTHLAIMPWNFPFWQVFRFLAPCLASGNSALLKHASNVTGCALAIESLFEKVNAPTNLFQVLLVSGKEMQKVISNPLIKGVSLTGSTPAGLKVIEQTSKNLTSTVLELGGSDPYIVFEDADIDNAIENIVQGRFLNCGQSCIAAKRLIVHKNIYEEFNNKLLEKINQLNLGPMASKDFRDELHAQVQKSIQEGARLLCGGVVSNKESAYYPATLLIDINENNTAFKEELFGPVACVAQFSNDEEALELANNTEFGLGSAIFTQDNFRIDSFTSKIEAGCVFVNHFVKSDPSLPFGGEKLSGIGRELSEDGIKEFVNIKTISIK